MVVVAVVLAGGRSSRLGGAPKASLVYQGRTLLEHTLDAVSDARHIVVVGDPVLVAQAAPGTAEPSRRGIVTREQTPFAGPAAAIAVGFAAAFASLESGSRHDPSDRDGEALVLVLACDMPRVGEVVGALAAAADRLGVVGDAVDR